MMSETAEEIAMRLAHGVYPSFSQLTKRARLANEIEAALNAERERALRLIDEHQALDVCNDNCWTTIKNAIRGSKR